MVVHLQDLPDLHLPFPATMADLSMLHHHLLLITPQLAGLLHHDYHKPILPIITRLIQTELVGNEGLMDERPLGIRQPILIPLPGLVKALTDLIEVLPFRATILLSDLDMKSPLLRQ